MTSDTHAPSQSQAPASRRWIAMTILLLASFMNVMDMSIVNVALPIMQTDLGATASHIEWVVAGYVLAFALGLLPFGRLGDIVGRRLMFVIGVVVFTLMSLACGAAPDIDLLVAFRILQGLGGAMMMPQVPAITQTIFPPHERGPAFALFGVVASLAGVSGPLIGGLLMAGDIGGLSWRPIFLINVPVGVLVIAAALTLIPSIPGHSHLKNDWIGIVLAGAAVLLLVYPLIEGAGSGWPAWSFAMMAAAAPVAAAFYLWERRRKARNQPMLLPVQLMHNRDYMIGAAAVMVLFSGLPGFFMIIAIFLQSGFGLTPLQSGVTTIPFAAGVFLSSALSGKIGDRAARLRLVLGPLVIVLGMVMLHQTVLQTVAPLDHWTFVLPLLIGGLGMGICVGVLFQSILINVPPADAGSGSGALQAFQQVGGALGVAVIGYVFFSTLTANGVPDHAAFVAAAAKSVLCEAVIFAAVAVLTLFLTTSRTGGMSRHVPESTPR